MRILTCLLTFILFTQLFGQDVAGKEVAKLKESKSVGANMKITDKIALKSLYNSELKEKLIELDSERKSVFIVGLYFLIAIIVLILIAIYTPFHWVGFLTLFVFVGSLIGMQQKYKPFSKNFSDIVTTSVIKAYLPGVEYSADGAMSADEFHNGRLYKGKVSYFDVKHTLSKQGLFKISRADVQNIYRHYSDVTNSRSSTEYVFQGTYFIGNLKRRHSSDLFIIPKESKEDVEKFFTEVLLEEQGKDFDVKLTGNDDFDKEYHLICANSVNPSRVISHRVMTEVLELQKLVGEKVALSIREDKLQIAINKFSPLNPNILKSYLTLEDMENLVGYIPQLTTILSEIDR